MDSSTNEEVGGPEAGTWWICINICWWGGVPLVVCVTLVLLFQPRHGWLIGIDAGAVGVAAWAAIAILGWADNRQTTA